MTQQELTAIGILAEKRTNEKNALVMGYPLGYDSMPKEKQAQLDDLTLECTSLQGQYQTGYEELHGEQRKKLTSADGPMNNNALATPGQRVSNSERQSRIYGDGAVDEFGFTRYQRERRGRLLNFKNNDAGYRMAEMIGAIALAELPGRDKSDPLVQLGLNCLRDKFGANSAAELRTKFEGPQSRDLTSAVESYGGILVPTALEAAILILQEDYGVVENYANVIPMGAGEVKWPKRFQGPVAVHTIETIASSFDKQMKFNSYSLNAVDAYCFVGYPNQLSQDSIIPLGDYVAGQIAWAMSYRWNDDLVNADGSPEYGNQKGLINQFNATLPGGGANPGVQVAASGSQTDWSTWAAANGLADFGKMKGLMRLYNRNIKDAKWYCTWPFYTEAMQPLQASANYGWNATFEDGKISMDMGQQQFQGHEVVIIPGPILPTAAGASNYMCFFGFMDMAVTMGIRLGLDILSSQVAGQAFLTNSTYVRGIQRACVVPHSVGLDTLDPKGTNIPGPLVALKSHS